MSATHTSLPDSAETLKLLAETKKIHADTEKTEVETSKLRYDTLRAEVEASLTKNKWDAEIAKLIAETRTPRIARMNALLIFAASIMTLIASHFGEILKLLTSAVK